MHIIDIFAGAGGLAEGFLAEGFSPLAHIEMDKDAANTLMTRTAYHYLNARNELDSYVRYLKEEMSREVLYSLLPDNVSSTVINETISSDSLKTIYSVIDRNMDREGCKQVDVLIGGPPCQTYSIISRNNRNYQNQDDHRNHLYKLYAEMLAKYLPKFFVFENVPGIKTIEKGKVFEDLLALIQGKGYTIMPLDLNATAFGVLQNRTRVILIGWRREYEITNISIPIADEHSYVVDDLLRDLSPLEPGEEINHYISEATEYLVRNEIRSQIGIPLTQHMCRYHNEGDREIYRIAIDLWNREKKRLVYSQLPSRLITRKKPEIFKDKYKVVAGDLPYSHTVISHIAKDGHYYIHPDLHQARSLSVREAARLQSFPDSYFFEGARIKKYTQIGNAVPPLMGRKIAQGIKEALNNVE